MWPFIVLICLGATPIFEAQEDNPWDELRDVFYTHRFSNGQVYEHKSSLDRPPWSRWTRFYADDDFHADVLNRLDEFLKLPKSEVEEQPSVRRAIMFRDLWPVFDAHADGEVDALVEPDGDAKGALLADRKAALRQRVANVMRRLELSDAEAAQLPDNYKAAVEEELFPTRFDPQSPEKGFMPADLFDETGPWVAIARATKTPGGLGHLQGVQYRSIFVPYIRVSDNRHETLDYLTSYRVQRTRKPPPKGTLLALVRRTALPTTSRRIVATPLMESLQLIVVDPPRDHHFKFVMDRAAIIAGRPGLRQLTNDDPIDAYSFEAGGLFPHKPKTDTDGEFLVLGRHAGPVPKGTTALGNCFACHMKSVGPFLFANFGSSFGARQKSWADQLQMIISEKENSAAWKAYQATRNQ